jgi:hypothetical protein
MFMVEFFLCLSVWWYAGFLVWFLLIIRQQFNSAFEEITLASIYEMIFDFGHYYDSVVLYCYKELCTRIYPVLGRRKWQLISSLLRRFVLSSIIDNTFTGWITLWCLIRNINVSHFVSTFCLFSCLVGLLMCLVLFLFLFICPSLFYVQRRYQMNAHNIFLE